jgi:hypothetical protein
MARQTPKSWTRKQIIRGFRVRIPRRDNGQKRVGKGWMVSGVAEPQCLGLVTFVRQVCIPLCLLGSLMELYERMEPTSGKLFGLDSAYKNLTCSTRLDKNVTCSLIINKISGSRFQNYFREAASLVICNALLSPGLNVCRYRLCTSLHLYESFQKKDYKSPVFRIITYSLIHPDSIIVASCILLKNHSYVFVAVHLICPRAEAREECLHK